MRWTFCRWRLYTEDSGSGCANTDSNPAFGFSYEARRKQMRSVSPTQIVISTSRKPSQRTRSLCKELQILLPEAVYIQRGKSSFERLLQDSEGEKAQLLLLIGERSGNPGRLDLYQLEDDGKPILSFGIDGVRLSREFGSQVGSMSEELSFATDSSEISTSLGRLLEGHFRREPSLGNMRERRIRILSINDLGNGKLRLTFKDSESGRELGPSITGAWRK